MLLNQLVQAIVMKLKQFKTIIVGKIEKLGKTRAFLCRRNCKYVTAGGLSAGIDMTSYLVSELAGIQLAQKTAKQMEYRWQLG